MGIGETRKIKVIDVDGSKLTIKEERFGDQFTIDDIFDYMEECRLGYSGPAHKKSELYPIAASKPYVINMDGKGYVVVDTSGNSIKFAEFGNADIEGTLTLEIEKKNLVDYLKSHEIKLPRDSSIFPW